MASELMECFIPFKRIMRFFDTELSKELAGQGYSYGQWPYVFMIGQHEGASIKDLCIICGLDKGNSTRMISKLLEAGLAENRSGRTRTYSLYLTEAGWKAYGEASDMLSQLCRRLFSDLSEDEIASLKSSLAKICIVLDREYRYQ